MCTRLLSMRVFCSGFMCRIIWGFIVWMMVVRCGCRFLVVCCTSLVFWCLFCFGFWDWCGLYCCRLMFVGFCWWGGFA